MVAPPPETLLRRPHPPVTTAEPEPKPAQGYALLAQRPPLLAHLRPRRPPRAGAARGPARQADPALLDPRPRRLHRVPAELLRRGPLREHGARDDLRDQRAQRRDRVEALDAGREALDARDRRRPADRQLEGRHGDGVRPGTGTRSGSSRPKKVESSPIVDRRTVLRGDRRPACSRSTCATDASAGHTTPAAASTRARPCSAHASASPRTRARSSASTAGTAPSSGTRTSSATSSATRASTRARRPTGGASSRSRARVGSSRCTHATGAALDATGSAARLLDACGRVREGLRRRLQRQPPRVLNAATGRSCGDGASAAASSAPALVVGGLVFFSTLGTKTYAARVGDGRLVWRIGMGKYSPGDRDRPALLLLAERDPDRVLRRRTRRRPECGQGTS